MRRILSNSESRILSLIEYLSTQDLPQSIGYLATRLNVSERTLKADLDNLEKLDYLFKLTNQANYIQLKFNHNQNIQTVYQYVMEKSDAFRIIEALLYNGSMSMDEMVEHLYVSRSTIYRILPSIQNALEEQFRISISSSPIDFVGDEGDIRFFLSQFIAERYVNSTLSFEHFDEASLRNFLIEIGKALNTEVNYTTIIVVSHRVYTNYLRTKLGYVQEGLLVQEDVVDTLMAPQSSSYKFLKVFFNKLQLLLTRENFINLFSDFLLEGYYYSVEEMMNSIGNQLKTQKSYLKLSKLLTELSNLFHLAFENKDFLIYILHNTMRLYKHEVYSNYILFNRKGTFVERTRKQFPQFTKESYTRLSQYLDDMGIHDDPNFTNHMYYTLFTHWKNLTIHLNRINNPVRALILSDFDIYHANMLQSHLENSLIHYMEFSVYSSPIIDYSLFASNEFDLIIANFPLPTIPNTETVTVNTFPTDEDVLRIFNLSLFIAQGKHTSDKLSEES